jgi:multiple sugar transport system ATP-binding protein
MALADHIVVMNEGRILQADSPEGIYDFPSELFVARFIGRPPMNLLALQRPVLRGDTGVHLAGRTVDVPRTEAEAASAILGIRPEHARLVGADQGALGGEVDLVEYFGSHWVAQVRTEAGSVKVLADKSARPEPGDRVGVVFDARRIVLFDAASEKLIPSAVTRTHTASMRHG